MSPGGSEKNFPTANIPYFDKLTVNSALDGKS